MICYLPFLVKDYLLSSFASAKNQMDRLLRYMVE